MGKEQTSDYYDRVYATSKEYSKDYTKSIYLPLWKAAEKHLINNVPVLDIGCGVGQCAAFLHSKGYNYLGIDFSHEAINKAIHNVSNKDVTFFQKDIFDVDYTGYLSYQLLVSETLEHLDNDLGLLEKLSKELPNKNIVITVPSFNSKGHARYFKTVEDVILRYKNHVKIIDCYKFSMWFVLHASL